MKYAGYVDEATGLPIIPGDATALKEISETMAQTAVVAKQRVEGHGGKSPIIEEVKVDEISSDIKPILVGQDKALFDFLRLAADQDETVPHDQPSRTLRKLIKSPTLKPCTEKETRHESQLLSFPMPLGLATVEKTPNATRQELDCWSILAECSTPLATPTVELSAFLLLLSANDLKAECILPFPVDTHKTTNPQPTN